jgi:hypothetical protein
MFFHGHLIIGYVQEPENDRYLFQLAGGEEYPVSKEEFLFHWQQYRAYEDGRAEQNAGHYRALPVTLTVKQSVKIYPANPSRRRKRKSA